MNVNTSTGSDRGQILILAAVMLTVILGIAALSVDASFMYDKRNRLHGAADAAAKAAALELARGNTTPANLQAFAYREFTILGFNPGGSTVVTVNHPPVDGNFAMMDDYVQVKASEVTATFFGGLLGFANLNPGATAVAGVVPSTTCMLALGNGTGMTATGNSVLTASTCGIAINSTSTSPAALLASPGSTTVNVQAIDVTGGSGAVNKGGGVMLLCCPMAGPNLNVPPLSDPLSGLAAPPALSCSTGTPVCGSPTQGNCVHTAQVSLSGGTTTLNPGTFCNGINLDGGGAGFFTLAAGIYILQGGGLTLNHAAHLTGSNVLIYNTGDAGHPIQPIDLKGGPTTMNLSGRTVAPYAGIAVMEDPTLPGGGFISENDSQVSIDGALYFPNSTIAFQGNTTFIESVSMLIGKSLSFLNSATVNVTPSGTLPSAIKTATLAE